MTVLDVGCGDGTISEFMGKMGAKVLAIDMNADQIEKAKQKSTNKRIEYLTMDIDDFLEERVFDVIVFADVIEHFDREKVFRIIRRLTRYNTHEDTRIYINIPDGNFIKYMQDYYPEKLHPTDESYPIDHFLTMFKSFGYAPVELCIYGIDTDTQYNEYVFVTEEQLNKHYKQRLGLIYKEEPQ